jgi:2-methylcitrate dehydratase PrpD
MKNSAETVPGESPAILRLARFATELKAGGLPPEVVAKAKICVLDALSGCLTIGANLEGNCALALAVAHACSGKSTVYGTALMTSAADAAFVNAVTAAGTSRSDTHAPTATHPGTVVVPVALAVAEAAGRSGSAVLEAVVSGYEVMCRLGLALITPEFAEVFRPTGMVAPTAAAIAAGRAMGLELAQLANAASLATHFASGLNEWANSGTSELPYHSGFAARNGVDCALLAERGTVSASTILEGRAGLLAGHGALSRASRLTEELGSVFRILEVVHKPAPACIYAQTPVQIASRIVRGHDIDPQKIESIVVRTSRAAALYPGCDDPGPIADAQAAKLSIQFGVASVFVARGVFDTNWRDYKSHAVNALSALCTVQIDDRLAAASPARQSARVKVVLKSGETIHEEQDDFVSMSEDELVRRFLDVAEPKLGRSASARVLDLVERLERLEDVSELARALRADTIAERVA